MTVSLSSLFCFLFLVSHLVTTTTVVVIATEVVNNVENGAASIENIDESETLTDEILHSTQDAYDNDETNTNITKEDKILETTDEDSSDTISDPSTASEDNDDQIDVGDSDHSATKESVIEDATSYDENELNNVVEGTQEPVGDNVAEEIEDNTLLSSEPESTDAEVENEMATEQVEDEEEEIDSTTSSSPSENYASLDSDLDDESESSESNHEIEETSSASSSEKTTKSHPEVIEKKRDMEGGISTPPESQGDESSNTSSGSSAKSAADKDVPKKTIMRDDSVQKPPVDQDDTEEKGDVEEEEEQEQEDSMGENASSDANTNTESETESQDENPPSSSKSAEEYPVYENENTEGDSLIDLDGQPEALQIDPTTEQNKIEENNENDNREVSAKATARARAREDRRSANSVNENSGSATELPTAATTDGYRGEPWGQYRSTRRLPDLELLQMLFENSNKTRVNEPASDAESQKVVNDWQKDPLYDEKMAKDAGSGEPVLGDQQDQKFLEYRDRLLGKSNDGSTGANQNTNTKSGDENAKKETQDTEAIDQDANANSNIADVNSEFVEGLDDIDKFFEGVNPPDELDVGYGSSIQDVLMDKGKHILLKKVRGVARWIKIGWQTMGNKLAERISEFQLPFQNIRDTKSTESDTDAESSNSSKSVDTDQIVKNTKKALVTTWRVGKQAVEVVSDFVDGLLDRFEDRDVDDSGNFDDFAGFDLDNLPTFEPPV